MTTEWYAAWKDHLPSESTRSTRVRKALSRSSSDCDVQHCIRRKPCSSSSLASDASSGLFASCLSVSELCRLDPEAVAEPQVRHDRRALSRGSSLRRINSAGELLDVLQCLRMPPHEQRPREPRGPGICDAPSAQPPSTAAPPKQSPSTPSPVASELRMDEIDELLVTPALSDILTPQSLSAPLPPHPQFEGLSVRDAPPPPTAAGPSVTSRPQPSSMPQSPCDPIRDASSSRLLTAPIAPAAPPASAEPSHAHVSLVPTAFSWTHEPCKAAYICGSFNAWTERIPMRKRAAVREGVRDEWSIVLNLPPGEHTYKFIIEAFDGAVHWRHAPDQPTSADASGPLNNHLWVVDQHCFEVEEEDSDDDDGWCQDVSHDYYEMLFVQEPPAVPQYLLRPHGEEAPPSLPLPATDVPAAPSSSSGLSPLALPTAVLGPTEPPSASSADCWSMAPPSHQDCVAAGAHAPSPAAWLPPGYGHRVHGASVFAPTQRILSPPLPSVISPTRTSRTSNESEGSCALGGAPSLTISHTVLEHVGWGRPAEPSPTPPGRWPLAPGSKDATSSMAVEQPPACTSSTAKDARVPAQSRAPDTTHTVRCLPVLSSGQLLVYSSRPPTCPSRHRTCPSRHRTSPSCTTMQPASPCPSRRSPALRSPPSPS